MYSLQLPINETDAFELYGPGAAVSTQTAAASQWVRQTLDSESMNFLAFIESGLAEKRGLDHEAAQRAEQLGAAAREIEETAETVTFEELLPFSSNSRIVAAQALLHTLSLATKGMISVRQEVHFGGIGMSVVQMDM